MACRWTRSSRPRRVTRSASRIGCLSCCWERPELSTWAARSPPTSCGPRSRSWWHERAAQRGDARRQPRPARPPRPRALRHAHAARAGGAHRGAGARARPARELLPDQPRGRVRRAPALAARRRGRDPAEPRRLDPLLLGDPRRAGDRRAARAGDPPLRRRAPRAVAARVGHQGAVLRDDLRARGRGLRGRARDASRGARRGCAGMSGHADPSAGRRAARVAEMLGERGLDALLVETPADLRYLTGFSGSHGMAVLRAAAPEADAAAAADAAPGAETG